MLSCDAMQVWAVSMAGLLMRGASSHAYQLENMRVDCVASLTVALLPRPPPLSSSPLLLTSHPLHLCTHVT